MIELSTTTAFMLYLIATLSPLLILWAYQHFQTRKHKIATEENDLRICEFCHFCYLGNRGAALSQCPQCRSFNKTNK